MRKNEKADLWMPLYIADYLSDTMHLTRAQHGSYLLVLMALWKSGGELPVSRLAAIARMTPVEWQDEGEIIMEFLTVEDGKVCQKRLMQEVSNAQAKQQALHERGKTGAQARWADKTGITQAMPEPMLADAPSPSPTPLPSPTALPTSTPSSKAPRAPRLPTPGFNEFWASYPKKVGKQEAELQWNLLAPDEDLRITIMAALEEQKQSHQWSNKKFIKDPERWIKKRRWDDEVPRETDLRDRMAEGNDRIAQAWADGAQTPPLEAEL